jgi:SHS2 domain-containing protein
MKKYRILPHTADIEIEIFGKTKNELFENALFAMAEILAKDFEKEKGRKIEIKIKSENLPLLLADFLNEVLYFTMVNKEIYPEAKIKKLTDKEILAEILGKKVNYFQEDIKAVTYYDLNAEKDKKGFWKAKVVFDI